MNYGNSSNLEDKARTKEDFFEETSLRIEEIINIFYLDNKEPFNLREY